MLIKWHGGVDITQAYTLMWVVIRWTVQTVQALCYSQALPSC